MKVRSTGMARLILTAAAFVVSLTASGPARAGDFLDTRITFTVGDDNFFKNAGEQVPDSPLIGIGDRPGYELPFDNLDLATSGRENELHLVLYKKMKGIFPGLITEAAAALEFNMTELESADPDVGTVFSDDSSYIRLAYALDAAKQGTKFIDLVLFPLSGDRFRVGYLYDLTWGGKDIFPNKKGPTPAFKLGGDHGIFYWWAGMKLVLAPKAPEISANQQGTKHRTTDNEVLYGALAGLGVQPIDGLSIDLSGGHIQMAWNPIEKEQIAGSEVTASGLSARIAYGHGMKVGLSSDLRLLRNDPQFIDSLHQRPTYNPGGGLSWRVAAEGNAIAQVLADPDQDASTKRQWATAAALDFRLQINYFRFNFTGVYRSLEFALLSTPSFIPFQALPQDALVDPQLFFAVSADYHFPRLAISPGIQVGVEMPAAFKTQLSAKEMGPTPVTTLLGEHTMLVRSTGERVILPEGEGRLPIYSVRVKASWYASDFITLIAFVLLSYDENHTTLTINPDLTKSLVFDDPLGLGAGLTAQARF